jgi:hypothetical protein
MVAQLSPKIWSIIAELASADDDSTGRALSHISRSFRDVSHLSPFQSITLDGLDAMKSINREMERCAPEDRVVHFVYLKNMILTPTEEHEKSVSDPGSPWQTTYDRFFTMISETVEVLTIDAEPHWTDRQRSLSPTARTGNQILHFPRLRSLTACETALNFLAFDAEHPALSTLSHSRLPVLERLHLFSDVTHRDGGDPFHKTLLRQMPCLTHIRVSDVFNDDALIQSLEHIMAIPRYITEAERSASDHQVSHSEEISNMNHNTGLHRLDYLRGIIFDSTSDKIKHTTGNRTTRDISRFVQENQGSAQICIKHFYSYIFPESGGLRSAWKEVIRGGLGAWDMQQVSGNLIYTAPPAGVASTHF